MGNANGLSGGYGSGLPGVTDQLQSPDEATVIHAAPSGKFESCVYREGCKLVISFLICETFEWFLGSLCRGNFGH